MADWRPHFTFLISGVLFALTDKLSAKRKASPALPGGRPARPRRYWRSADLQASSPIGFAAIFILAAG